MAYGVTVVVFSDYHLFPIFLSMWDFGRVYVVYRLKSDAFRALVQYYGLMLWTILLASGFVSSPSQSFHLLGENRFLNLTQKHGEGGLFRLPTLTLEGRCCVRKSSQVRKGTRSVWTMVSRLF